MKKPKRLAQKAIYRSPWVSLFVDKVLFPGGRMIPKHHRLDFKRQGVAALVRNASGQILLIQSYRYVTDTLEWEIPAGAREGREQVTRCAGREVFEETGYQTSGRKVIFSYYPSIGISNLIYHVVACRAGRKTGVPDPNEVRQMRWCSENEVRRMIRRGKIRDGFTLTALLWIFSGAGHE